MGAERIFFFDDVGEVIFKKNNRAKRLTIRIRNINEINVTVPYFVSYAQAESFVRERTPWIKKMKVRLNEQFPKPVVFHELTEYSTYSHTLRIERTDSHEIQTRISDGKILVSIPFSVEVTSKEAQDRIRKAILNTWKKEAKLLLPGITETLARTHGFNYSGLSIKQMKTRWGSCSAKNKINLNLHLIRLPQHLYEYVILHELVHTIHKNHGRDFWEYLDKKCGGAKSKAKELRSYRPELY